MQLIEQAWRSQGYSESDIQKMLAVMNHPEAHKHALETKDFNAAYAMTLPKEESKIDLNLWFSSFTEAQPEDAKSLSIALTKFSRYVQSEVDKKKAL